MSTTNVLIVDDEASARRMAAGVLESQGYCCTEAADAESASARLRQQDFDLAITDINMPGSSGLDLVKYIHSEHPNTAVVMVTGVDDPRVANIALKVGAYGYLIKPFKPAELLIHVDSALLRRNVEMESRAQLGKTEQVLLERTAVLHETVDRLGQAEKEIRSSQEETILRLARAAEFRDDETGQHVRRMSRYCALLAQRLGHSPERCELIRLASMMHDMGKVGIPDRVLFKPGLSTSYDIGLMRQHCEIGYRILVGSKSEVLQLAAIIALSHHEKYDGSGYPRGLSGDAIPLEGRIAAVADVFDALTSKRVYKPAHSVEKAVEIMRQGRGKHFDPFLLDLFLSSMDQVLLIRQRSADRMA